MDIQDQLTQKLAEINDVLAQKAEENKEVGVLSGISGISLFQFYYSKFLEDDSIADLGAESITKSVEYINNGFNYPTFCAGIAGACWVLEILKEEEFVELEEDIFSPELNVFLFESMKDDIEQENYDFLHGAMGYGFYFFKRYQNAKDQISKNTYKEYIVYLIDSLRKSSRKSDHGIWWESVLRKEEGLKGCNLSLSHGMSSTINFLSRLADYDDFYKDVIELIKKASSYIISCRNKDASLSSSFPNWIIDETPQDNNSRLAWCYGDLGIGISLLRAAEVLKDDSLYQQSIGILKRSTKRRDLNEASVLDAGLCHGAYGIMHIYSYLHKKTKEPDFRDAADFWASQSLAFGNHQDGYAGYMAWRGGDDEKWIPETSLLEGVAGMGLSIISYLAPFDTKWDECLLIG